MSRKRVLATGVAICARWERCRGALTCGQVEVRVRRQCPTPPLEGSPQMPHQNAPFVQVPCGAPRTRRTIRLEETRGATSTVRAPPRACSALRPAGGVLMGCMRVEKREKERKE